MGDVVVVLTGGSWRGGPVVGAVGQKVGNAERNAMPAATRMVFFMVSLL